MEGKKLTFLKFRRLRSLIFWEFTGDKMVQMEVFWTLRRQLKLISRKIKVAGKLLNFHTVVTELAFTIFAQNLQLFRQIEAPRYVRKVIIWQFFTKKLKK